MGNRSFIFVLLALAVVGLLGFGMIANGSATIAVGEPTPDAEIERLGGEETASIADYRGQWVLVNFWASWCKPCELESPAIEEYSQAHNGDVVVLGVNTRDLTEDAEQFIADNGLTWEMLHDGDGSLSDSFGSVALPESFLVDPEGNLALIRRGPVDEAYLEQNVTPLIEANGGAGA